MSPDDANIVKNGNRQVGAYGSLFNASDSTQNMMGAHLVDKSPFMSSDD